MSGIQPRTLSNTELINFCSNFMDSANEMPTAFQLELLRRFTALAPVNEFPPKDERQLDLFMNK